MDDLILLISESYKKDAIGNVTVTETATSVWAHLQSVTRAEWADAGQNGLQPQLVAVTPIVNYNGEQIVQIGSGENARRYAVYRTYLDPDNDSIEAIDSGRYLLRAELSCNNDRNLINFEIRFSEAIVERK